MLFLPKRKPNLNKYMLWSDSVHLTDPKYFIYGPFSCMTLMMTLYSLNNMLF